MNINIVSFENEYAQDFYTLNIEWLKSFFYVEPYDEDVLSNPNRYIIQKGGHIFFAKLNNEIVATIALMPLKDKVNFELTKMAVSPKYRGKNIGQKLMIYCLNFVKKNKIPKLIIYSNTKLENAIYIYKKYGFVEIPLEPCTPYKRSNIKLEFVCF